MLASAVVKLRALETGYYEGTTGPAVHGFWFQHWEKVNKQVHQTLHQKNQFSLSPLLYNENGCTHQVSSYDRGMSAWFRVATLTSEATVELLRKPGGWLDTLPEMIRIYQGRWALAGVILPPEHHPWCGICSYLELVEKVGREVSPRKWTLEFVTPTTSNGPPIFPLPLPDILVASWQKRWQMCSSCGEIVADLRSLAHERLTVVDFDIHAGRVMEYQQDVQAQEPINGNRRIKRTITGCLGTITFKDAKVRNGNREQKISYNHYGEFTANQIFDLLIRFAFFSGSGYRTTQGLGMTRARTAHSK